MDQRLELILKELRKMTSEEAADWLIQNCPITAENSGDAFLLLPRISWQKCDQLKLANHYLSKIPYASHKPYEVFASFMQLGKLISVMENFLPPNDTDKALLRYHLGPILNRAAKSDSDQIAASVFMDRIQTLSK
jgi:hypothetical protein